MDSFFHWLNNMYQNFTKKKVLFKIFSQGDTRITDARICMSNDTLFWLWKVFIKKATFFLAKEMEVVGFLH